MYVTRSERTKKFRDNVEQEWKAKYKHFFESNLDKDWNVDNLSMNHNIKFDIVKEHLDLPWNWYDFSERYHTMDLTLQDVIEHIDLGWHWGGRLDGLTSALNITIEEVISNINLPWAWNDLTFITSIENIMKYPDLPWYYEWLLKEHGITREMIEKKQGKILTIYEKFKSTPKKLQKYDWDMLSNDERITFIDVLNNSDKPWSWYDISRHKNITFKNISEHPKLPWRWNAVFYNPNIKIEHIFNNLDLPWDWNNISYTIKINSIPNTKDKNIINIESIMKRFSLNWTELSYNKNITFDFVLANLDKPWKWDSLSRNPIVTMENILEHRELPWNWKYVSSNPSISMDDITNHPEIPWDWSEISDNDFQIAKERFINNKYKEYMMSYRIQQYWNKAITTPSNIICIKRLLRAYNKYQEYLNTL